MGFLESSHNRSIQERIHMETKLDCLERLFKSLISNTDPSYSLTFLFTSLNNFEIASDLTQFLAVKIPILPKDIII